MKKIILLAAILAVLGVVAVLFAATSTSDKATVDVDEHYVGIPWGYCWGADNACCKDYVREGACGNKDVCIVCGGTWDYMQ